MPRLLLCALLAAACSKSAAPAPGKLGDACSSSTACEATLVCTDAPVGKPATPGHSACAAPGRHYTFRAIAGVSMGASGGSRFTAQHSDLFDSAGFLGGPLDAALLVHTLQASFLGGFCPPDKLEAAAALDALDGGNRLDRPDGIPGCTQENPPPVTHYSRSQRFNHWAFTTNGGHFDRGTHLDIFRDLTLAIGNPIALPLSQAQVDAATCAAPVVVPNVIDARYSPHGEHSAITFCDGDAPVMLCADGTLVDWCAAATQAGHKLAVEADADGFCAGHGGGAHGASERSSNPAEVDAYFAHTGENPGCWAGSSKVSFEMAIDLNGNGRRDYHEPVLTAVQEPFSDVGKDGCDDAHEDGKGGCVTDPAKSPFASGVKDPNGDDYDPQANPGGTEGNFRWDEGEPFQDVGLDGVPGTHDEGEGDGKFTMSAGLRGWYANDLPQVLAKLPEAKKSALDLYIEGGIRDVFDLAAMAEGLAGQAKLQFPRGVNSFQGFFSIPPVRGAWGDTFDPLKLDLNALGSTLFLAYGNPNASLVDQRAGDGDHVGTPEQVYDRFLIYFRWLSRRWDAVLPGKAVSGVGGTQFLTFDSQQLGGVQDYAISLPPQYDDPANAQKRYPVLFLLHGYGQTPQDFSGTSLFINTLSNLGQMREIIVVYPSGRCCLNGPHGEKTCRDHDDNGVDYTTLGYVRDCARGNFYLDRAGGGGNYGGALVELMGEVDKKFRTLPPADGPAF